MSNEKSPANQPEVDKAQELLNQLSLDLTKFRSGNKAAAVRARKSAFELIGLFSDLRRTISSEKSKL